jgi:diguanylate cyclase (GGDEF)-like protein
MEIEERLSHTLSAFAWTLLTGVPVQGILDRLVADILEVVPVSTAGVTLLSPDARPTYLAASDDTTLRFEQAQSSLGSGPCQAAFESGETVGVADLAHDDRFPAFARRAQAGGIAAVFAFPLRHGDVKLGVLDLYRATAGPLTPVAVDAAQMLANVSTAYLLNAQRQVELEQSSERSRHDSRRDAVTRVPDRHVLRELVDHAILRCRRSGQLVAVLLAHLEHIESVNDTYGRPIGDALLSAIGARLVNTFRPGDTVACLAVDEFAVVCEDLADESQAELLTARIESIFVQPFALSGIEVQVTASTGIAFGGQGRDDAEQVLHNAETSMHRARRYGLAGAGIIDAGERRLAARPASLNRDLRSALKGQELRIDYQPIVATADGRITGAEALLRWTHPTLGPISPETIVLLAEQSGLMTEMGRWVLERACRDRHRWDGYDHFEIAVNVSADQLMAPGFVSVVAAVLDDTHTDAGLVILELTESVLIRDSARALGVLNDLKGLGVSLALDDFGTGFSSLSYLKQLSVDIVKIDRSFIVDVTSERTSRILVGAIIGLAHDLHIHVVAEGIESSEQHDQLAALGCDLCQGFYFAGPLSVDDLDALMTERGRISTPTPSLSAARSHPAP